MDKKERKKLISRRDQLESYLMTLPAEKKNHPEPASIMERSVRKELEEISRKLEGQT